MKVSFTGNHLYTYKYPAQRDVVYDIYRKDQVFNQNKVVCKVGEKDILILDGKEMVDYNKALASNIIIKNREFENALRQSYITNSVKVDLSNTTTC